MRILVVCLGNICRSPIAEGVLREKLKSKGIDMHIDSAGTGAYHVGEAPDHRAIKTAKKFGVDISQLRARQFSKNDFDEFDLIYVMDSANLSDVVSLARNKNDVAKVRLFLEAAGNKDNTNVPDPWYGGMEEFENVFYMLNEAADKIAGILSKETSSLDKK